MAKGVREIAASLGLTVEEYLLTIASGSALPDFEAIGTEDTGSLGLSKPIGEITASMNIVLNDLTHNDHPHLDTIQFVTAKMYDINSMLAKNASKLLRVSRSLQQLEDISLTLKPRFINPDVGLGVESGTSTQQYTFTRGITGSLQGNVTGNVSGSVTGSLLGNVIGDVTGDVTGKIRINNTEGNLFNYPIVVAQDTTPDNGAENLGASKLVTVNGKLGEIKAIKFIGESNSHMGYTSSIFITPDQFAEVANTQRRQLFMNVSGSNVATSHDNLHFVTNFQVPKGLAPTQVKLAINNPHLGKEVKVFANKYFDGTTASILYSGNTIQTTDALQTITLTKTIVNAIRLGAIQNDPFYFTLMVGPLAAGDQIFGAQITYF